MAMSPRKKEAGAGGTGGSAVNIGNAAPGGKKPKKMMRGGPAKKSGVMKKMRGGPVKKMRGGPIKKMRGGPIKKAMGGVAKKSGVIKKMRGGPIKKK